VENPDKELAGLLHPPQSKEGRKIVQKSTTLTVLDVSKQSNRFDETRSRNPGSTRWKLGEGETDRQTWQDGKVLSNKNGTGRREVKSQQQKLQGEEEDSLNEKDAGGGHVYC